MATKSKSKAKPAPKPAARPAPKPVATAYKSPAAKATPKTTPVTTKAVTQVAASKTVNTKNAIGTTSKPAPHVSTPTKATKSTTHKAIPLKTRQQQLSNQYGISTFNDDGSISTVPTLRSGGFSDIYVGTGKYADFDTYANAAVQFAITQEKTARQQGAGVTVSDQGDLIPSINTNDPIYVPDPTTPTRFIDIARSENSPNPILTNTPPERQQSSSAPSSFNFNGITDFLENHYKELGLGIAAFLIVMALVKKKW